jgi:hypothetical protein
VADPLFDQLSATTLADLRDDILYDEFFVDSAWMRKMRVSGALDEFMGGTGMQIPFQYNRVIGGAIQPGSDVTVLQQQIIGAMLFQPKEYYCQIPLNLFRTNVLQHGGPAVKVKEIDAYFTNAIQAMNTDIGIDFYHHGQSISGSNRIINVNGLSEALNDGINPSYDGNVFATYGGQLRNGVVGNTLNSVPIWAGSSAGDTGQVSYKLLAEAYLNAVQRPDIGLCNKALYAYLLERQEPKQRADMEVQDVNIGMSGLKLLDGIIFEDKLAPSTKYGTLLPSNLSATPLSPLPAGTTTFTTPTLTASQNNISNFPSATACKPGEPFFWLRMKGWKLRPSSDPEYNFNFTPPIRSNTNPDLVTVFLKAALNIYCTSPRDNIQVVGAGF